MRKKRLHGSAKAQILATSSDFDEPLAEFEERPTMTAAEALADLPGTLSRQAGETWLADSRETGLAGSWIGDQPVGTDGGGKLAGMIMGSLQKTDRKVLKRAKSQEPDCIMTAHT